MVSLKKGILRIDGNKENTARWIYELTFVINTITLFAFNDVKFIGTLTGIVMLAAAMLLWLGRKNSRVVIPYNTAWYIAFTVFSAISCLWSMFIDTHIASYFLRMVVIIASITSVSIYVDTAEDLERLIKLFILSMTIIVFMEFAVTPSDEWASGVMGSHFSGANQNSVAFLVFCAELMAFYEFYSRGRKRYVFLIILFVVFVVLSGSRKALFAAVAGPLMFVFFSIYKRNYLFHIILIAALAAFIVFIVMNDVNAYNSIGKRFESMLEFWFEDRSHKVDNSLYMRSYYIQLAQEMFGESPVFGKGMGNFARIIDEVYELQGVYSHNNFWQILSELGIVGFFIYYSMYAFIIIKLIRNALIHKSRISLLFLTFMILLVVLETGFVTYNSKMPHIVIAIAYTATYVGDADGRKYSYIENHTEG
ncbi:MAG: O-antigen ligase family protein [Clostridia bacterium]|nr:O-antigen ligase family protein [Clostridia bacterium]